MKYINIESIKRITKKGKMVLIPFALVSALLTGCASSNDRVITDAEEMGYSLSQVDDSLYDNPEKLYFIEGNSTDNLDKFRKLCTVEEFSNYVNETNVTWDDIKNKINNLNDNRIRNILLKGVSNLENNNLKINLDVLNYNLNNLTIEYFEEEDNGIFHSGYFDAMTCVARFNKAIVNDPKFEKVVTHEILGHGMNMAYIESEGILCSPKLPSMHLKYSDIKNEKNLSQNSFMFGESFNEALAEIISVIASGKKISNSESDYYDVFVQELLLVLKTTDTSISEYANKGTKYLLYKMKEAGCENPYNLLLAFDNKKYLYESNQSLYSIDSLENIEVDYLIEIGKNKKDNNEDIDSILEFLNNSLDSYSTYIIPEMDGSNHCIAWYSDYEYEAITIEILKNRIKNNLSDNKVKSYSSK